MKILTTRNIIFLGSLGVASLVGYWVIWQLFTLTIFFLLYLGAMAIFLSLDFALLKILIKRNISILTKIFIPIFVFIIPIIIAMLTGSYIAMLYLSDILKIVLIPTFLIYFLGNILLNKEKNRY